MLDDNSRHYSTQYETYMEQELACANELLSKINSPLPELSMEMKKRILNLYINISRHHEFISFENFSRELKNSGIDYKELGYPKLKLLLQQLDFLETSINEKNQSCIKLVNTVHIRETAKAIPEKIKLQMVQLYDEMHKYHDDVLMSTFLNQMVMRHQLNYKFYDCETFKEFLQKSGCFTLVWKHQQQYLTKIN